MRTAPIAGLLLAAGLLTGCGHSTPPVGQVQAAAACKSGGSAAASFAAQAAAMNPKYAQLSTDEAALAASEATQDQELSDGDPSDDAGLGALTGADAIGSTGDMTVIGDCTSLGLSVTPN